MLQSLLTILIAITIPAAAPAAKPFDASVLLSVAPIPVKNQSAVAPVIRAKAALAMDLETGLVLFKKNEREAMPMASLTKIMTALLILENHEPGEIVTVDQNFSGLEGVKVGLKKGEKITVQDLLIGLLVPSGGDAAVMLAKYHSGSVEAFVNAMNDRAAALGMSATRFTNPVGLDGPGHQSSAADLALLFRAAWRHGDFRTIVAMPSATIGSVDGKTAHAFSSTNQLLGSYLEVLGGKTGTTDGAGQSVMNIAKSPQGHAVLTVLLNSPDRFQENKALLEWVFRNHQW